MTMLVLFFFALLADRWKYAGFNTEQISVISNLLLNVKLPRPYPIEASCGSRGDI